MSVTRGCPGVALRAGTGLDDGRGLGQSVVGRVTGAVAVVGFLALGALAARARRSGRPAPRARRAPWDPAELARRGGQLLLEKVPLFLVSAAAALVTYWALDESQAMVAVQQAPFGLRFSNGLLSCVGYLGKFLVPVNLAAMYPLERAPDAIRVTGATLLLLRSRWPPWLAGGADGGGWRSAGSGTWGPCCRSSAWCGWAIWPWPTSTPTRRWWASW